jgi:APA family basic amino acid/polyamine antiporter
MITTPALRRALGRWDLTAIGVNQVIGGAIFVWPAQVAAQVGAWSPFGFVLIGLLSLSVALCFAEVSSRFDGTGGPYLYARTAFGDFVGFEVGWMQWFSRSTSQASIMAATVLALGYFWPSVTTGRARAAILIGLTVVFAAVNVRGIRQSSWVVNALTIGKLVPLAIFILVGLWYIHPDRFTTLPSITATQAGAAALLLVFVYGGYEVVPVPAGEALDPRRDVPFAIVATIVVSMVLMTLAQIVAQGVLPDIATHSTPIADAAAVFLGAAGGVLIGVGSVMSMSGNNAGQVLNGSRMLFALAEQGQLPRWFGVVDPTSQTPVNAILFTSAVALALALSGSFAQIAVVSALARVLMYAGSAAATLRLRTLECEASAERPVRPATFVTPFGTLVPLVAIATCVGIAFGATQAQLIGGLIALGAGGVLYAATARGRRSAKASRSIV